MIITDAGSHIWRAASPDNAWMPARKAHLDPSIDYEDLRRLMVETGVHRHVLIPPSWESDRADYLLEGVAKYPAQFVVMGRIHCRRRKTDATCSRLGSGGQQRCTD